MLSYIKKIADPDLYNFHIVTFEQAEYSYSKEEKKRIKTELLSMGIEWRPRTYHSGSLILLKKAWDTIQTFFLLFYLRFFKKVRTIFAFANVAAAFSVIFKRLFGFKMIIFSYEPHSEFLAELSIWDRSSLKYKILASLEKKAGYHADFILTGTKHMVAHLSESGSKAEVYRAPTGVSKEKFHIEDSSSLKAKYGIGDKQVLFYIGKFGDLYYSKEIPELFKTLKKSIPDLFFFVVTPTDLEYVQSLFSDTKATSNFKIIPSTLTTDEVRAHINMGDICLSAVPPTPSQKFRSPTKVAEYLLCGKPIITARGVSEDDDYAINERVGVVLEDFSQHAIESKTSEIKAYLSENKEEQRQRCRNVGIEYRDEENVTNILIEVFNKI